MDIFSVKSNLDVKTIVFLSFQIMELFKVAPFDQNLCMNGTKLLENSKTLAELKVKPQSLIYLRADEVIATNGHGDIEESWTVSHPEEGFKGSQRFIFILNVYLLFALF